MNICLDVNFLGQWVHFCNGYIAEGGLRFSSSDVKPQLVDRIAKDILAKDPLTTGHVSFGGKQYKWQLF